MKNATIYKRKHSPSSINTLNQCPRKYWFNYIAKLKTRPSIHLVKGSLIHEVFEDFYDKFQENLREHLFNLFEEKLKKYDKRLKVLELSEEDLNHHIEDCKIILETHWMITEQKMKGLIHNKKAENMNNAWFLVKPKFKEMYVKSNDLSCRGYIDRIHKDYNGAITLGDYKTSNKTGIGMSIDYKRQLSIYALLYNEQEGVYPDYVSIIFLRFGEEYFLEVTPSLLKFARDTILDAHSRTESDEKEDYPLKESRLCGWCDFQDECSEHSEFAKDMRLTKLKAKVNQPTLCEFCGSKEYEPENSEDGTQLIKHKKSCEYKALSE